MKKGPDSSALSGPAHEWASRYDVSPAVLADKSFRKFVAYIETAPRDLEARAKMRPHIDVEALHRRAVPSPELWPLANRVTVIANADLMAGHLRLPVEKIRQKMFNTGAAVFRTEGVERRRSYHDAFWPWVRIYSGSYTADGVTTHEEIIEPFYPDDRPISFKDLQLTLQDHAAASLQHYPGNDMISRMAFGDLGVADRYVVEYLGRRKPFQLLEAYRPVLGSLRRQIQAQARSGGALDPRDVESQLFEAVMKYKPGGRVPLPAHITKMIGSRKTGLGWNLERMRRDWQESEWQAAIPLDSHPEGAKAGDSPHPHGHGDFLDESPGPLARQETLASLKAACRDTQDGQILDGLASGRSQEDIAAEIGISQPAVSKRIARIRASIQGT